VSARALRDERWATLPAREIVPHDVLHVRAGDIVPADIRLADGAIDADQSMLTGEQPRAHVLHR